MKQHSISNPSSPISRLFQVIMTKKIPYIKHYKTLDEKFGSPKEWYNIYLNEEKNTLLRTIRDKGVNDIDGCLGTYLRINPNLISPPMYEDLNVINEYDRKIITEYRTGSHSLKIQTGRMERADRIHRMCICESNIQTINHVLFHCPLTSSVTNLIHGNYRNLGSFFDNNEYAYVAGILRSIESNLQVRNSVGQNLDKSYNFVIIISSCIYIW